MRRFTGICVALAFLSSCMVVSSCGSKSNPVTPSAPGAPSLSLPSNGATNLPVSPTLTWASLSGASSYSIQVSTSSAFSTLALSDSALTTTTATAPWLLDNSTYFWRIRAKGTGGTGAWSNTWQFTVLSDTTIIQGSWLGPDPSGNGFWLYAFKRHYAVVSKISITTDTSGNSTYDTLPTYWGDFSLDSSVTPNMAHNLDIHLITPQYSGQTIQTLYDYEGVQGSFVGCIIMLNTPGASRPTSIADTLSNYMELRYQFVY